MRSLKGIGVLKGIELKNMAVVLLAFMASALLLTVVQLPMSFSIFAWVSLVPFILICSPGVKPKQLFFVSYMVSLFYWLGNLYWLVPVTVSGWLVFCLYTALLWPLAAVVVRSLRIRRVPLFLVVPVVFVAMENLQGFLLGGFPWRLLAYSQYENISLIQIADIFGAGGVSFFIAMVNGFFADFVIACKDKKLFRFGFFIKAAVTGILTASVLFYGNYRIAQTADFVTAGPVVGSVQSNVPQSVKESYQAGGQIFEKLIDKSNHCIAAGADLVVWPETMVLASLDERVLRLLGVSSFHKKSDRSLREHSKSGRVYLLAGAYGGVPDVRSDMTIEFTERYNSAFLYRPDGSKSPRQYNKIHLVPFGEVVPFKKSAPWLYGFLMKFTPYDYDYSLSYGADYTVFEMAEPDYKFSVMICYEDTIADIAREFALDENKEKRIDWLVNISNDGWFVRFDDGQMRPSAELSQHTVVCVFRAVENRLAVVRSVNTGISCLIDTAGQVKEGFLGGDLPVEAMARQGVEGWFVDRVPIDSRVSFFSKYGRWLDFCCTGGFVLIIIVMVSGRFFQGRIKK